MLLYKHDSDCVTGLLEEGLFQAAAYSKVAKIPSTNANSVAETKGSLCLNVLQLQS